MKRRKKNDISYKSEYFKLIYQLIKYLNRGKNPPAQLLKQIREIEPLAGISREHTDNI
jgi:hypothetical protein